MSTYNTLTYDIPPYHEGNVQDFEFEFDENFPVEDISDISMQVRRLSGALVFEKVKSKGEINLSGRVVNIPIVPVDTKGNSGSMIYEIDIINLLGNPFASIRGKFVITKEINDYGNA